MDPHNKLPGIENETYYPSNWAEYTPYGCSSDHISIKKEEFDDPLPSQQLQPEKQQVHYQINEQVRSTIEYYISLYMQSYTYSFEEIINGIESTGISRHDIDIVIQELERKSPNFQYAYRLRVILSRLFFILYLFSTMLYCFL